MMSPRAAWFFVEQHWRNLGLLQNCVRRNHDILRTEVAVAVTWSHLQVAASGGKMENQNANLLRAQWNLHSSLPSKQEKSHIDNPAVWTGARKQVHQCLGSSRWVQNIPMYLCYCSAPVPFLNLTELTKLMARNAGWKMRSSTLTTWPQSKKEMSEAFIHIFSL